MNHFAMLSPHEQLVVTALHLKLKGMFSLSPKTLYGPPEIPGGPPLSCLDHVENHWYQPTVKRTPVQQVTPFTSIP